MSGGGVLQHLMAEQSYRTQGNRVGDTTHESSRGNSPLTKAKQPPSYPQTPPRRAFSDEAQTVENTIAHPFNNSRSRSAESSSPHFLTSYSAPHPPPSRSALISGSGVISRLRKEFLSKPVPAQPQANQVDVNQDRLESTQNRVVTANHAGFVRGGAPSPGSSKLQLHGHPKSNSAGEEFLYTDRKAKLAANKLGRRRGKNTTSVMRSRSLHYGDDAPPPHVVQRRPATDLGLGTDPAAPRKRSDASTVSSGSTASDKPGSHGSSTGDHFFQISINEESSKSSDLPHFNSQTASLSEVGNTQYQHLSLLSNMVLTPSGMGGPAMTQNNPHGPYYATVPTNPLGHHPMPQRHSPPPHQPIPQTTATPRGPPPPYPKSNSLDEEHHPQRPNSLPLSGQVSRKKMEYGTHNATGGLTSPAISTTAQIPNFSYPMSAGTPIHGTPFYTFQQDIPVPQNGGNNALQGHQANAQQVPQGQFKRSGSANGFQQLITTTQSQHVDFQAYGNNNVPVATTLPATSTVGTPISYQQQQTRYIQHHHTQKQQSTSPTYNRQQVSEAYAAGNSNGFSLGKSDSNASTSSGGSRIARRTKRNSKNFSNTSGSSSSTGNSRPNSSADYLERILNENETLKTQLHAAEKKLKKFQNVEKDLQRVSEEYKALHMSVVKSEKMESVLRTQLEAANRSTQQENEILKERIETLDELVRTLQLSNKDAETSSGDIMSYKVKVQELQANEQLLNAQLGEARDKISEQQQDIALHLSKIKEMQANAAALKNKLVEKQRVDQFVEGLTPLLEMLRATVQARLQAENELNEVIGVTQRQSTSSNDEGISEMDPVENAVHAHAQSCLTQSSSSTLTRDEQLIRLHAEMLKLRHVYLHTSLLRELSIGDANTEDQSQGPPSALYSMLYKHRHAASDPSFNKHAVLGLPSWHASGLKSLWRRDAELRREHMREESKKRAQNQRRERTSSSDHSKSSPRRRRRDTAPSEDENNRLEPSFVSDESPRLENSTTDSEAKLVVRDNKQSEACSTSNVASNEFDSPSEGYHSQQSSGSPTPSSERSSVLFPDGDSRPTAALPDAPSCSIPAQTNVTISRQSTNPTKKTGHFLLESGNGAPETVLTKLADV